VKVTRALLSVSDKTGIVEFASYLSSQGIQLLSTGGTAKALRDAGLAVTDVSDFTGAAECLDGRVKTLHPKVHGGLLAVRGNPEHEKEMAEFGILPIDLTVLNLYPFEATVNKPGGSTFAECVENIDIGGPSMMRSTAKNHQYTAIVTNPEDYKAVMDCMKSNGGASTSLALRRWLASKAFALSASYDSAIATYMASQLTDTAEYPAAAPTPAPIVHRAYQSEFKLKYGCNPHQQPSQILSRMGHGLPFEVLNGVPGYINLLDAANAYQLVAELREATGLAAAASFKHVSPAGAALAVPLTPTEAQAYEIASESVSTLTPPALAYLRARNADPMCSFGDFCALSEVVDEPTAMILKREVSDGIVAPGYTEEALKILESKKGGNFIILKADPNYRAGDVEYREVYGMAFMQRRNDVVLSKEHMSKVVTQPNAALKDEAVRDLLLASICVKYTQSNSVGFASNGMMVGVGAGQQSRVDCVKLAGRKVAVWYLRQHPKVLGLPFKGGVKRQDRVNARVRYIEGDFTEEEKARWLELFEEPPSPLTEAEKQEFLQTATGLSLSSDAFFPFRDSIDHASKLGVTYVAQPGGSVQDVQVVEACNQYGMSMVFTGVRLFHH
jgi:phosphoribosylaminoimidazolecarboxamide formyltransferase/IMP cyclohydrolase